MLDAVWLPAGVVTVTCARPLETPGGTKKVTCGEDTKSSGGLKEAPVESTMVTEVPANVGGSTPRISPGVPTARSWPKANASEPSAMAVAPGFAAEIISGVFVVNG